jgi:hypothetical protein
MKIEISRSFSKKVQLKQYEPIDVFCAAKAEIEVDDYALGIKDTRSTRAAEAISEHLDEFVRAEVDRTLAKVRPPLTKQTNPESSEEKVAEDAQISIQELL